MPRIFDEETIIISTGGPAACPVVVVVWGPNFGEVEELPIGIALTSAVALDAERSLGHAPQLTDVSFDILTPIIEGVSASMELGLDGTAVQGITLTMPVLAIDGERSLGHNARMDELASIFDNANIGSGITLPALALDGERQSGLAALHDIATEYDGATQGLSLTVPALAIDGERSSGLSPQFTELAADILTPINQGHSPSLGNTAAEPGIAIVGERSLGSGLAFTDTLTQPGIALDGTRTHGVHVQGEVTGAPFWQNEFHLAGAAPGSLTVDCAVGDLLIAWVAVLGTGVTDISLPSGWTQLQEDGATAQTSRAQLAYKVATATQEIINWTVTATTETHRTTEVHVFNGVDATTPVGPSAFTVVVSAADPSAPTVSTPVANCMVVAFLSHDHAALTQSHTPAAGHSEKTDYQSTGLSFLGASCQMKVFATAAATGTLLFDCTEIVATAALVARVAIRPGAIIIAA